MTRREFVLRKEGVEVARHPTREPCMIKAFERHWVLNSRWGCTLAPGVTITEEPAKEQGGRDAD